MIDSQIDNENQTQSARRELYEVYADSSVKLRSKRKLIERLDEIYGYDLAFVMGLIMRSKFSGNLNIISQSNDISGITFSNGQITKIDLNDKETIMGELIIKEGLIERDRLHQLLHDQAMPLGELLIKNNIATKEQIISVLVKQMRLRLSKYINNNKYRLNFSEAEVADYGLSISYNEYLGLAHDWVAGRFNAEWLKLHYMEVNEGLIEIPIAASDYSSLKSLPLLNDLTAFLSRSNNEKTFSKIFASIKNDKDKEYFLKCFHYGIMSGQIVLRHDPEASSQSESILKNIYDACSKKTGLDLLETLAHILKFKPTEIDSIFQAINTYVHAYTGDDYEMKNNMFRIVLEMLSKKQFYQDEISRKYSTASVNASYEDILIKKIPEIYNDLLNKNLFLAVDRLKKLTEHSAHTPKLKLYMVWAKALMIHQNNIKINLSELDREFLQILPEDKDTAEYFYVKSILFTLKKDEVSAHSYFQQAIKLNAELKQYPPVKQTGSFIKKLFKFSIVFLFLAGPIVRAQELSLDNEEAKEAKKSKLALPFVYLNQSFNYKVTSSAVVQINDISYNLSDINFERNANTYEVTLSGTFDRYAKAAKFYQYSSKTQKLAFTTQTESKGKFRVKGVTIAEYDYLCLIQKNRYTNLQFCKSLNPSNESGVKDIMFNNELIESEGKIVLSDTSVKAKFTVNKKNNDFLTVQTVKRTILPLKIEKPANSEDLLIRFIDAGRSRFAWEEKINLNQNSFSLKFDELLTLEQGIFFKSTVKVEEAISQLIIDKDKLRKKYYNKLIISPLIVFEELASKSKTIDAILRSDIGLGFSVSVDSYLENQQNIFGALAFYNLKLSQTNNSTAVDNSRTYLLSMFGGYKYTFNEDWTFSGILRLDENLFLIQTNSIAVELTKAMTKMIGISPEYIFYTKDSWVASADAGLFVILPTEIKNSTPTELGTYFSGNLKASYKVNWGRLTAGATFGSRTQKNATYSYVGSTLIYRVGLNYLF